MNEFDKTWIGYDSTARCSNESTIITNLKSARRIVFIAKGRVGLQLRCPQRPSQRWDMM